MGWFLKKKKKKRRSGRRASRARKARPKWDPARTLLGLKVLAVAAVAVAAVFGWHAGERHLRGYVTERGKPSSVDRVVLADAPAWLKNVLDPLRQMVAAQIDADPLNPAGLHRAALALEASPWIERVERVQRVSNGQVRVYARYREPIAVVQALDASQANAKGGDYHLVDRAGVLLPMSYSRDEVAGLKLPVIVGVSVAPPDEAGLTWRGPELEAGLRLVRLLADAPYLDQIEAFDVGDKDRRGRIRLVLWTRQGWLIRWGLPPGAEQAIEQPAEVKKRRLAGLYANAAVVDAGPKVVDLYGGAVFVHHQGWAAARY